MLTVEQLRRVRPDQIAAMGRALSADAERVNALISDTVESAGRDLAGWRGPAAAASTAHRHALADDAGRLRDARTRASAVITTLADRLDEARQLLALADSFATLVGCQVHGRGEVTALPPAMLGPLATVYDSVRRTAGSLAGQALVVAEAADRHATAALDVPPTLGIAPPAGATPTPAALTGTDTAAPVTLSEADRAATGGPTALAAAHPEDPATTGGPTAPVSAHPEVPPATCGPQRPGGDGRDAGSVGDGDLGRLERLVADHPSAADLAPRVARLYGALPEDRRAALQARPALVAELPGGPLTERYAANRALVDANRAELRRARTALSATPAEARPVSTARTLDAINQRIGTLNSFLAVRATSRVDPATGMVATARQERRFLAFDPSGAGRAAEAFGDVTTARCVAVLVPGGRNGLDTFNAVAIDARLLADTAGAGTATIAWLGYDSAGAAGGTATARHTRARTGGQALRRFLAGLVPCLADGARLVLVGHGFGTVLVAAALRAGCAPDDVVLVGSPGLGQRIRRAADLRPARPGPQTGAGRPATRVWAVRAPGDAIAYSRAYGPDPAEFADVTRLETQGGAEVVGHTRYYAVGSESLDNLARVVSGRLGDVSVTDTTLEEELMLAGIEEPAAVSALAPAGAVEQAGAADTAGPVDLDGVLDSLVGGTGG